MNRNIKSGKTTGAVNASHQLFPCPEFGHQCIAFCVVCCAGAAELVIVVVGGDGGDAAVVILKNTPMYNSAPSAT